VKCPYCSHVETRVIDSRSTEENSAIRRRRECTNCNNRFRTYEKIDEVVLVVIKSDGRREVFSKDKIISGILRAGVKREIPLTTFEDLADDIERELCNKFIREIKSHHIGEMILERLRGLDEVAYVRFASVYRKFKDIESFKKELNNLLKFKETP